MKIVITGGGTAGHINPALAIAEYYLLKDAHCQIFYIGAKNGLEKELASHITCTYIGIDVAPLNKRLSLKTIAALWKVFKGFMSSLKHLKAIKPDIVIGTGGYVAGSVCLAASLKRVPVAIHEQNAYPGMTNRILGRFVDLVMITFEPARAFFKNAQHIECTGLPILSSFYSTDRQTARKALGLEGKWFLLCVGGSNGALALNETMLEVYQKLTHIENLQILHVTGRRYYEELLAKKEAQADAPSYLNMVAYADNMPMLLNAADLVITRAGASTIVEILACQTPAIVIPSPNVANNHQYHNALHVESTGLGIIIEEKNMTAELLVHTVQHMHQHQHNQKRLRTEKSTQDVMEHIDKTLMTLLAGRKDY